MRIIIICSILLYLSLPITGVLAEGGDEHQHGASQTVEENKEHGDEEGHADELVIELSPEAVKLAGIQFGEVTTGRIGRTIELPGEIGFNEDRLAHISPRFAGVALQANYRVGDYVDEGKVVAIVESNESMNPYSIKAPISGWVIERHITQGEYVSEESSIYVIADLSLVWVNLAVYPKDAEYVQKGQTVTINVIGSNLKSPGTIEYLTPIMDFHTRSLTARIILPNPDNQWRPGSFVQATINTETGKEGLIVEKDAVQYIDEKSTVFILDGPNRFKPVEVILGEHNSSYVRIIGGLKEGNKYVSKGAFDLKAKIVTSNMDAHAGHGH